MFLLEVYYVHCRTPRLLCEWFTSWVRARDLWSLGSNPRHSLQTM